MFDLKQAVLETSYWEEKIQNDIYISVVEYMKANDCNQTDLAKLLGVGRSRVSQILNGRYNPSMKKYTSFCLALGKVPVVSMEDPKDYIDRITPSPNDDGCKIIPIGTYTLHQEQPVTLEKAFVQV